MPETAKEAILAPEPLGIGRISTKMPGNPANVGLEGKPMEKRLPVLLSLLAIGGTLILLFLSADWKPWFADGTTVLLAVLFGMWVIVPPIWFLWEWYRLNLAPFDKEKFDTFKHSQDLAKNLWAAIALLLGLLLHFR